MSAFPAPTRRTLLAGAIGGTAASALASPRPAGDGSATRNGDPDPIRFVAAPQPLPARESEVRVPGGTLWCSDTGGAGTPVVLLHANTGSGHGWGYQQPILAKAGYRVIAYSRRGYRGSSAIDPARPGRGDEDLAALADALGLARFHAVGTAAGAFVATALALAAPQRLLSLTLACTIVAIADPQIAPRLTFLREPWWQALPHEFRELGPSYRAGHPDGVAAWRALQESARGDNPPGTQPPGASPTLASLAKLAVPTLLIAGDADLYAPPPIARTMARAMPAAELAVIPECGHSAHWERPDVFNRVLLDFLNRNRGRPA